MEISFATTNRDKFQWAEKKLSPYGIELEMRSIEVPEIQSIDVEEVVRMKAEMVAEEIDPPFIVDDSGFEIKALDGFPGALLKPVINSIGAEGLCRLMDGEDNRKTNFRSCLAFVSDDITLFTCNDRGELPEAPRGDRRMHWGEMMKLHIPEGFENTLAEMSDREFERYEKKMEEKEHYVGFGEWFEEHR